MSIPRIGGSNIGSSSSTNQACAACKHQRRKCAPDCILAPYFPHHRQRQFLNAHKLFGVSNITKIIKNLKPPEKAEAMRTIIFQSDARANDPVGGCYRIIHNLQSQIEYIQAQLDLVHHQLAICRAQAQHVHQGSDHHHHLQMQPQQQQQDSADSTALVSEIVNAAETLEMYDPVMQYHHDQSNHQDQEFILRANHNNNNDDDNNCHLQEDASAWTVQESSLSPSSPLTVNLQPHYANECDNVKPFIDINDVKFEPEELIDRSFVSSTQLVISS